MGSAPNAAYHGQQIYIHGQRNLPEKYKKEKIIIAQIWACRLMHGSYSWLLTGATNSLSFGTSDPLQHWWLRIETNCAYYTIQKSETSIGMHRTNTPWEANQNGLACVAKQDDAKRWVETSSSISEDYKDMEWFINHLEQQDFGQYRLLNANCQDFATGAFRLIKDGSKGASRCPNLLLGIVPLGLKH